MNEEVTKKLIALNETEFKKLYEGSFAAIDMASKKEDDRTVLVVAHNYNQFRYWQRKEQIRNAIYIGLPHDFNGRLIPQMFRLLLLDGYYENRCVIESYEFEEAYERLDVSRWYLEDS